MVLQDEETVFTPRSISISAVQQELSGLHGQASHPAVFARLELNNLPKLTMQGQRPRHFDFFVRTFTMCAEDEGTTWLLPGESVTACLRQLPHDELSRNVRVWSVVDSVKLVLQSKELTDNARRFHVLQFHLLLPWPGAFLIVGSHFRL